LRRKDEPVPGINYLRKNCKILMIDAGLDKLGAQKTLAEKLGINRNSLNMALTGYREGKREYQILVELRILLLEMLRSARRHARGGRTRASRCLSLP